VGLTGGRRVRIDVSDGPDGLVVALAGELDLATLPDVAPVVDELLTRPVQPLVLDVGELTFLDSSGVSLLVRTANHFRPIRTRSATEPVRRVIEVLGLDGHLGLDRR
jgi:anti-anti-sigma factor